VPAEVNSSLGRATAVYTACSIERGAWPYSLSSKINGPGQRDSEQ